jgi:hypothetical protein
MKILFNTTLFILSILTLTGICAILANPVMDSNVGWMCTFFAILWIKMGFAYIATFPERFNNSNWL